MKIAIIEDHPLIVHGLCSLLNDHPKYSVCGSASGQESGLNLILSHTPDVAVIDLGLAEGDGLMLVRTLKEAAPQTRIIVSSMRDKRSFAALSRDAGAHGFVSKEESIERLVEAIETVGQGEEFFPEGGSGLPSPNSRSVADAGRYANDPREFAELVKSLSPRELEAFRLIGSGLDTVEIAAQLQLSPKTIESFRARIKAKLKIDTPTRLVHLATQWLFDQGPRQPMASSSEADTATPGGREGLSEPDMSGSTDSRPS